MWKVIFRTSCLLTARHFTGDRASGLAAGRQPDFSPETRFGDGVLAFIQPRIDACGAWHAYCKYQRMNPGEHPLSAGATTTLEQVVSARHLASAFAVSDGESYPDVLATPAMVALLERTCAKLLEPLLPPGSLSVGAVVNITHTAPTALDETATAHATFLRREGPLYWFDVVITDAAGVVGKGQHARAIVNEKIITAKSEERRASVQTNRKQP